MENENNRNFYERVTEMCSGKNDLLISTNDEQFLANQLLIKNDSVYFFNQASFLTEQIITNDINEIKFKGTGTSIFEAIIFGGAIGGVAGNLFSNPPKPGLEKAASIVSGILIGSIVGIIETIINPPYTIIKLRD